VRITHIGSAELKTQVSGLKCTMCIELKKMYFNVKHLSFELRYLHYVYLYDSGVSIAEGIAYLSETIYNARIALNDLL